MRQFVFGILAAGFLWWGYGALGGQSAAAGETGGAGGAGAPANPAAPAPGTVGGSLGDVLPQQRPVAARPEAPADGGAALAAPAASSPLDLPAVLQGIAQRDAAAIQQGFAALAGNQPSAAERRDLAQALAAPADDFRAMLAQLGNWNTFLHSPEGRAQAQKVIAAAMAFPDAEAVAAGTLCLDLCVRGPIEKSDTEARAFVDAAYQQHRIRVDRWLCDPTNVQGARSYTVVGGDSLARIAGRFRKEKILVEDGTLAILNRIHNPNALQVGQKIKVPVAPIRTVLEKRSFALSVYVGDYLLRLYWVGHGEHDKTPVTEFTVGEKQEKPQWTAPDGNVWPYGHPKNILGEYFLKLLHESHTGFGVHGTTLPETVCTMSSMGCIRMLDADIAELFRLLPRGTRLEVRASAPGR